MLSHDTVTVADFAFNSPTGNLQNTSRVYENSGSGGKLWKSTGDTVQAS